MKTTPAAGRRIKVGGRGPAHPRPSKIPVTVRPAPRDWVRPTIQPIMRTVIAPAHDRR